MQQLHFASKDVASGRRGRPLHRALLPVLVIAVCLPLAACGGGVVDTPAGLNIGVWVDGTAVSNDQSSTGNTLDVQLLLGQSIELDANEPVVWTMYVGGTAVTGTSTVVYGGVAITQSSVSDSQIVLQTSGSEPLSAPVEVTLVATSQVDAQEVTLVHVLIQ